MLSMREQRAINALLLRPLMREDLDYIAGCSNGPALVAGLRAKGLQLPCDRILELDRDGKICRPGMYRLTKNDKALLRRWEGGHPQQSAEG